jgi:repressor of nif and glnA expression
MEPSLKFQIGGKPMPADMLEIDDSTRRANGRESRTQSIATRFTPSEEKALMKRAEAQGQNLREWAREVLLRETSESSLTACADHILTEVVALQLFLTEALSPVVCGQRMTSEQYDALLRNVKATKRRAAEDVIARFVAEAKEERHG